MDDENKSTSELLSEINSGLQVISNCVELKMQVSRLQNKMSMSDFDNLMGLSLIVIKKNQQLLAAKLRGG